MSESESTRSVVESLRERAGVRSVYGDPVAVGDRTLVPVARVAYGFGGGSGSRTVPGSGAAGADETGGGGGVAVSPVGVIEAGPDGTRLLRFGGRRRLLGAFGLGLLAGLALGRR